MSKSGYQGRWAYVDLTNCRVEVRESDPAVERDYVGGRGLQAHLLSERMKEWGGPLRDPLEPENRIIIGCSAPNDTRIHTAGRGSASFFSPLTRSEEPLREVLPPVFGMATHSSVGGTFPNRLKRAGIDQIVIDGCAEKPVRIEVIDGRVRILDAEPDLFETRDGRRFPLRARAMDASLKEKVKGEKGGSASLYAGPAGWREVPFACLTTDRDRNFGRGGAGAVFGSKNLVAVSVAGAVATVLHDPALFEERMKDLDAVIAQAVADPTKTVSFRPTTGTTWWLDRAFHGGYLGGTGGYLPWHNYDEGNFDREAYERVGTGALLEIATKHKVCTRCREILCSRLVRPADDSDTFPRPEFESAALFINCCITDRSALVRLNDLCNEVGLDTMSTAAIVASAMDLDEKGLLGALSLKLPFGDAGAMASAIEAIAYGDAPLGDLLAERADGLARRVLEQVGAEREGEVLWCLTTAYGGLGYAGIEPKAFPAMHACYATSNRGRGDHTYAWTVQAEEAGLLTTPEQIASAVAGSQTGKALVDSLGVCDFFPFDVTSSTFLDLLFAVTGNRYSVDELTRCGRRIVTLERLLNNVQGRTRLYDAFIPPKLEVPMTRGPMKGRKVDPAFHEAILDAYYREQGWTADGLVEDATIADLGLARPVA
jgi:aldehyde:ferredoxin oxidoreductase